MTQACVEIITAALLGYGLGALACAVLCAWEKLRCRKTCPGRYESE